MSGLALAAVLLGAGAAVASPLVQPALLEAGAGVHGPSIAHFV